MTGAVSFRLNHTVASISRFVSVEGVPDMPAPYSSVGRMFCPRMVEVPFYLSGDNTWIASSPRITGGIRLKSGKVGNATSTLTLYGPREFPDWVVPIVDYARSLLPQVTA